MNNTDTEANWKSVTQLGRKPSHAVGTYQLHYSVLAARAKFLNYSLAKVAEISGVAIGVVQKAMSGKHKNPNLGSIISIIQALELDINDVLDY